jgi:hypothetical protein
MNNMKSMNKRPGDEEYEEATIRQAALSIKQPHAKGVTKSTALSLLGLNYRNGDSEGMHLFRV